jgi:hypothetical protein
MAQMSSPNTTFADANVVAAPALLAGLILADPAAQLFGPDAIDALSAIAERATPESSPNERAFLDLALELCIEVAVLRIREMRQ